LESTSNNIPPFSSPVFEAASNIKRSCRAAFKTTFGVTEQEHLATRHIANTVARRGVRPSGGRSTAPLAFVSVGQRAFFDIRTRRVAAQGLISITALSSLSCWDHLGAR
jgi:hypothetical protein